MFYLDFVLIWPSFQTKIKKSECVAQYFRTMAVPLKVNSLKIFFYSGKQHSINIYKHTMHIVTANTSASYARDNISSTPFHPRPIPKGTNGRILVLQEKTDPRPYRGGQTSWLVARLLTGGRRRSANQLRF